MKHLILYITGYIVIIYYLLVYNLVCVCVCVCVCVYVLSR